MIYRFRCICSTNNETDPDGRIKIMTLLNKLPQRDIVDE